MIIDGKQIAKEVLARTKARAEALPQRPRVVAYVAQTATAATRSYLAIKKRSAEAAGCVFEDSDSPTFFKNADAAIIQFPTTEGAMRILQTHLLDGKDADVLSSAARAAFEQGDEGALLPPVVGAIAEIFNRYDVSVAGKRAVVVGQGFLVGAPAATWLEHQGASVTRVIRETSREDFVAALSVADIIVSGAGSPGLITPDLIAEGVVLVDAGTAEQSGKMAGDADPMCAQKCALFTPVPGGIGPIAVAKLFENAVELASRA